MKYITLLLLCLGMTSCSQTGHKKPKDSVVSQPNKPNPNTHKETGNAGSTVIQMEKSGGVYRIPVEINGVRMKFIFDTGASDITISQVEAAFLFKQGTLTDADHKGTQQYTIADGSVHEGTVINLRSVKIGNKELENVDASIVHNAEAPLLLGQSALSQFGKITIDYKTNQLIIQ